MGGNIDPLAIESLASNNYYFILFYFFVFWSVGLPN